MTVFEDASLLSRFRHFCLELRKDNGERAPLKKKKKKLIDFNWLMDRKSQICFQFFILGKLSK